MSQKSSSAIAVIGIDIGKNVFHLVGQDRRGASSEMSRWAIRRHMLCGKVSIQSTRRRARATCLAR